MPTRNVVLTDHQARLVERLVVSGRYQNASEVLREGIRLVERQEAEHEARLRALREAAAAGIADIEKRHRSRRADRRRRCPRIPRTSRHRSRNPDTSRGAPRSKWQALSAVPHLLERGTAAHRRAPCAPRPHGPTLSRSRVRIQAVTSCGACQSAPSSSTTPQSAAGPYQALIGRVVRLREGEWLGPVSTTFAPRSQPHVVPGPSSRHEPPRRGRRRAGCTPGVPRTVAGAAALEQAVVRDMVEPL